MVLTCLGMKWSGDMEQYTCRHHQEGGYEKQYGTPAWADIWVDQPGVGGRDSVKLCTLLSCRVIPQYSSF